VLKALSSFTPILVDGPSEKTAAAKYGVNGYPHTVFADLKGESVKEVGGYVETGAFLNAVQAAAKKVRPGTPSKDYASLVAAKKQLDDALAKKQSAAALAAIAVIEKVNHPGETLESALAWKKQLLDEGTKRLDAAKEAAKSDATKPAALKELKKLAADYKGTDIATQAAKLVKELEPPPDAGK
jgi:hypothetical protein